MVKAFYFLSLRLFLFHFSLIFSSLFLIRLDNTRGTFADSGTYALMGAAGSTSISAFASYQKSLH